MEKKTIGSFLSALRKASGLTQRQLADKLNVSDKAVSRWERDECAPDLSLIPVLAEIYGVTSDEILRGQRYNPETSARDSDTTKVEKQRRQFLSSAQTRFRIRSLFTIAIAVIGLITACVCNYELSEANIGFMLGSIFFIAAIVSQIVFTVSGLSSIHDEDWNTDEVTNCKGSMLLITEAVISGVLILFAGTLPMAGNSHLSVSFLACLTEGIQYMLITTVICFIASLITNLNRFSRLKTAKNRLRLRCSGILSVLLIVLMLGQTILGSYLIDNRYSYAPHDEFTSLRSFQRHMETEKDPDGHIMKEVDRTNNGDENVYKYISFSSGKEYILHESQITKQLVHTEDSAEGTSYDRFTAKYGYEFRHLNLSVVHYELSETDDMVPVCTFTTAQLAEADRIATNVILLYMLLYILPIAIIAVIYAIRRQKHS